MIIIKNKKFLVTMGVVFSIFFIGGYIGGALVSQEEKWPGAKTFWDAMRPF